MTRAFSWLREPASRHCSRGQNNVQHLTSSARSGRSAIHPTQLFINVAVKGTFLPMSGHSLTRDGTAGVDPKRKVRMRFRWAGGDPERTLATYKDISFDRPPASS